MTRMSYLVTGGSGFIGSHLVDALLERGNSVTILDNLSTGRESNLASSVLHPGLRFLHGSVLDGVLVDELVGQCDVVIHLAAAVGVKLIVEQPLRSFTTNIRGTEMIFEAAHRYRRKLMLASTSEIYGKNSSGPLHEESDRILGSPTVARWAYSAGKGRRWNLGQRLLPGTRAAHDCRAAVQHRRPAADRGLRHGYSSPGGAGAFAASR